MDRKQAFSLWYVLAAFVVLLLIQDLSSITAPPHSITVLVGGSERRP